MPTIRHRLGALVAAGFGLFLATAPAAAQPRTATITSGTVSCPVVNCLQLSLTDDIAGVGIDVTGTGTWELIVEGIRGPETVATWRTAPTTADADGALITSITAAGSFATANTGFTAIRIYPSSWTSGNPVISFTPGGAAGGAGGGGGGGGSGDFTIVAHNAAFGAAGSADTQVRSVQGIAAMTPLLIAQATAASLNATVVGTGTFAVQAAQSGTWNVTNVSGTVSLPTGASTAAHQVTQSGYLDGLETLIGSTNTALATLDGRVDGLEAGIAGLQAQLEENFGNASVVVTDPCDGGAKVVVNVNQTTSTQLFTGTASNRTYICSMQFRQGSASTQTFALISGTGTVCATSTGQLSGGTSAAEGSDLSFTLGNGGATIAKTDTDADNVCLVQSATDRLTGVITYVVAPQ